MMGKGEEFIQKTLRTARETEKKVRETAPAKPPSSIFAFQMKLFRNQKGWSPEELAKAAGVSLMTVLQAENKGIIPRASQLTKLADALEISEGELFMRKKASSQPSMKERLLDLVDTLNEHEAEAFLLILTKLSDNLDLP